MAIREIELLGSEVLRVEAEPVATFDEDLRSLVKDMFATMYHARGIGLAGPQVGVSKRVLVLDVESADDEPGAQPLALVNPEVVEVGGEIERGTEGCLSIPGVEEIVARPVSVVVEGFDPHGVPVRIEADGLLARALQHEIDHLDGVLFIDHLTPLKRRMLMKKWRKSQAEAANP